MHSKTIGSRYASRGGLPWLAKCPWSSSSKASAAPSSSSSAFASNVGKKEKETFNHTSIAIYQATQPTQFKQSEAPNTTN